MIRPSPSPVAGLLAGALGLAGLLGGAGCKVQDAEMPTGPVGPSANISPEEAASPTAPTPSVTITAPAVAAPAPGARVGTSRPTLAIWNATTSDGSTPVYRFEVATDSAFATIVTLSDGVEQGSGGQTSWTVPVTLDQGQYFWRVRGWVGSIPGPFTISDFTVDPNAPDNPLPSPATGIFVSDPLTTGGSTSGDVHGGVFLPSGWQVTAKTDFIRYEIPPLSNGYVEFDTTNLHPVNPNPSTFMLFGMWDPSRGPYRANPFRVHIQKLDPSHNPPYLRLRWISHGEEHDVGSLFLDWSPQRTYRWRLEWGPAAGGNEVRLLLDGTIQASTTYGLPYTPAIHWVELGIEERAESVIGAIYANVVIGAN